MKRLFSNQQANASSSLVRLLYITKRLTLFLLLNKIKYCRTVLKQLIFQSKKGLRGRSVQAKSALTSVALFTTVQRSLIQYVCFRSKFSVHFQFSKADFQAKSFDLCEQIGSLAIHKIKCLRERSKPPNGAHKSIDFWNVYLFFHDTFSGRRWISPFKIQKTPYFREKESPLQRLRIDAYGWYKSAVE